MARLLPAVAFLLLTVAIIILLTTEETRKDPFNPFPSRTAADAPAVPGTAGQVAAASPQAIVPVASNDPRLARYSDGSVEYVSALETSRRLHQSDDPAADLEILQELFANFRYFFKSNPVGSENAEITAQLLGENKLRLRLLDPARTPLDASGAHVDRWGAPYFFHPVSSQVMGIRSAGPDQKLWTSDDLNADIGEIEKALQLRPP